jgi:hypothetical protein
MWSDSSHRFLRKFASEGLTPKKGDLDVVTAEQAARDFNKWLAQLHAQADAEGRKRQRRFTQLEADVDQFRITYYQGLPASEIPEVAEIVAVIRRNRAAKAAQTRKKNRDRRDKEMKRASAASAKAAHAAAKAEKATRKADEVIRQGTLPFDHSDC